MGPTLKHLENDFKGKASFDMWEDQSGQESQELTQRCYVRPFMSTKHLLT